MITQTMYSKILETIKYDGTIQKAINEFESKYYAGGLSDHMEIQLLTSMGSIKDAHHFCMDDEPNIEIVGVIRKTECVIMGHNLLNSKNVFMRASAAINIVEELELLSLTTSWALRKKEGNEIIIILLFHIYYLAIHPFTDGNGRTARKILIDMLHSGFGDGIMSNVMMNIIRSNKSEYMQKLYLAQKNIKESNPDISAFMLFMLDDSRIIK